MIDTPSDLTYQKLESGYPLNSSASAFPVACRGVSERIGKKHLPRESSIFNIFLVSFRPDRMDHEKKQKG